MEPEQLIEAVAAWAAERGDVRAAFVVGSRARRDTPADRWSDVDVVLVVDDPEQYLGDAGWVEAFGVPLLTFLEATPLAGVRERRVLYDDALDVDFTVLPTAYVQELARLPDGSAVLARGFRLLVDTLGLEPVLRAAATAAQGPARPSAEELRELGADFWYHALWTAKKLARGEVWTAKECCDVYMKGLLLRLVRAHALASDPGRDTWHGGRFLERWADAAVLAALGDAFARYDAGDVARALGATMDLFERLERETAERLDLPAPPERGPVRALVAAALAGDG